MTSAGTRYPSHYDSQSLNQYRRTHGVQGNESMTEKAGDSEKARDCEKAGDSGGAGDPEKPRISKKRGEVTELLDAFGDGDEAAEQKLFGLLYDQLHHLAHGAMKGEAPGITFQTTDLIHEAYMRLFKGGKVEWRDSHHLYTVAAKVMRRILVNEARRRKARKRGGGKQPVSLEAVQEPDNSQRLPVTGFPVEMLDKLDKVLTELEADENNKRLCTILELHFFAGLTQEQTAQALGVSKGTVRRDWDFVKVWLYQRLKGE